MKLKDYRLNFSYIFLLLAALGLLIFSFKEPDREAVQEISEQVQAFTKSAARLKNAAQAFKFERVSVDSLQSTLTNTRLAYKKVEFILAYFYPEYVESHINGAPLLHLESENSRPLVLEPEGLQILDEIVFGEEVIEKRGQIAALAQKLETHSGLLIADFEKRRLNDKILTEAMQLQLVRVLTLGLTGFDTPGSLNALQETIVSLDFLKNVTQSFTTSQAKEVTSLLEGAVASLQKAESFDSFDRLSFLTDYINPVYRLLAQQQNDFNLPTAESATAWNKHSTEIFTQNFLDPYFFTELSREEDNPHLRKLGKMLFYDPGISQNGQISCATCHNPDLAFTDGQAKSQSAMQGKTVERNSPTLLNAVYADRYFYDMRAFSLEQQAEHVIFNELEFNTAHSEILGKLKASKQYKKLFKEAFGTNDITRDQFSKALASYVLSLRSFNSDFDQYVRGEIALLDDQVKKGFNLFMGKASCGTCHFAPTFSGLVPPFYNKSESEILGVLENPETELKKVDDDQGRFNSGVYREEAWIYEKSFKTTTVRNAALTAPYFHNGAYKTLEEVLDFYDAGGGQGQGMEVKNQTLSPDSLHLSSDEKEAIIAFIHSLNDVTPAAALQEEGELVKMNGGRKE